MMMNFPHVKTFFFWGGGMGKSVKGSHEHIVLKQLCTVFSKYRYASSLNEESLPLVP